MSYADFASYFVALVAITLAPGPVVLMLIVSSASKDILGAVGFGLGHALGGLLIISAVCFGLGAWLTNVPEVLEYSKYPMMAYILWLAYGIWKGGFSLKGELQTKRRSIFSSLGAGVLTCFISPYMMILFPLVLAEIMDITTIVMSQFLVLALITFATMVGGAILIIAFALQLSRLAHAPRSVMILNRWLASILVIGGAWMAFT